MDEEPSLDVSVDFMKRISPVSVAEVMAPASKLPVEGLDQLRDGHRSPTHAGQLTQGILLPLH